MLKIGDFSKLSRISIQMLRHYDKLDLLPPSATDEATGYRFYDEDQLPVANRIQTLKGMGFSLAEIGAILGESPDADGLARHWRQRLAREQDELAAVQRRICLLKDALEGAGRETPAYSITTKEVPALAVMGCRGQIAGYDREGELWERLFQEMERQHARPHSPAYQMAVFHDEAFREDAVDVEVQCAVDGVYESCGGVTYANRTAVLVAATTYQGSYQALYGINAAMAQWIKRNGYRLAGPGFNIYHVSPRAQGNPENMVTEVCFPVEEIDRA